MRARRHAARRRLLDRDAGGDPARSGDADEASRRGPARRGILSAQEPTTGARPRGRPPPNHADVARRPTSARAEPRRRRVRRDDAVAAAAQRGHAACSTARARPRRAGLDAALLEKPNANGSTPPPRAPRATSSAWLRRARRERATPTARAPRSSPRAAGTTTCSSCRRRDRGHRAARARAQAEHDAASRPVPRAPARARRRSCGSTRRAGPSPTSPPAAAAAGDARRAAPRGLGARRTVRFEAAARPTPQYRRAGRRLRGVHLRASAAPTTSTRRSDRVAPALRAAQGGHRVVGTGEPAGPTSTT